MTAVISDRPTLGSFAARSRPCRGWLVIAQDISGRIVNHLLAADKIPDHVFADFARIDTTAPTIIITPAREVFIEAMDVKARQKTRGSVLRLIARSLYREAILREIIEMI